MNKDNRDKSIVESYPQMKPSPGHGSLAKLLVLVLLAGCSTSHYRKSADKETYAAAETLFEQHRGQERRPDWNQTDEPAGMRRGGQSQSIGLQHVMDEDTNEAHQRESGPGIARGHGVNATQRYDRDQQAEPRPKRVKSRVGGEISRRAAFVATNEQPHMRIVRKTVTRGGSLLFTRPFLAFYGSNTTNYAVVILQKAI
jgi:hypothetical protein